jgi:hypothetical protein
MPEICLDTEVFGVIVLFKRMYYLEDLNESIGPSLRTAAEAMKM